MSKHRNHPIYVVRTGQYKDTGCGHQHSYDGTAVNCAVNTLRHHPTLKEADIVRINKSAVTLDVRMTVIETISLTASE